MNTVAYIRVSTRDKQDPLNQLPQVEALAAQRGWNITQVYEDRETASGTKERPAFKRLMEDARRGTIDLILFWSLDRFSREGVFETMEQLKRLDSYGCRFLSIQEQYLDTLGPFREAVIGILAAVAKLERQRISERVKAGLDKRRARGLPPGGRPRASVDLKALRRMKQEKWSIREMAEAFGVGHMTVHRRLKELG